MSGTLKILYSSSREVKQNMSIKDGEQNDRDSVNLMPWMLKRIVRERVNSECNIGQSEHMNIEPSFKERRVRTPWIANKSIRERLNRMSKTTNRMSGTGI